MRSRSALDVASKSRDLGGSLPGLGVIYNPRSSYNRRHRSAGLQLERALGDHGIVRRTESIDALRRAAEEFKQRDVDLLCISGGDGTSGMTISKFLEVYRERALPKVAILRGGTANTLADSLGIPRLRPERMLRRVLRASMARLEDLGLVQVHVMRLSGPNRQRRDLLRDSLPPEAALYGFLCGVGVVSGFLQEYYASGPPSARVAAMTLARGIGSTLVRGPMIRRMAAPFRGSVELPDGTRWEERDYLAVACGTIEQIGLGFKPFYRAHEQPGKMHVLGIYTSPFGFVRQLPNVWRGKPMAEGHTYEALVDSVRVRGTTSRLDFMVDGDLYTCEGALDISLGPSVRIVTLRG